MEWMESGRMLRLREGGERGVDQLVRLKRFIELRDCDGAGLEGRVIG